MFKGFKIAGGKSFLVVFTLVLLGGLICIVMAYYCIKALMGGKQEG